MKKILIEIASGIIEAVAMVALFNVWLSFFF